MKRIEKLETLTTIDEYIKYYKGRIDEREWSNEFGAGLQLQSIVARSAILSEKSFFFLYIRLATCRHPFIALPLFFGIEPFRLKVMMLLTLKGVVRVSTEVIKKQSNE